MAAPFLKTARLSRLEEKTETKEQNEKNKLEDKDEKKNNHIRDDAAQWTILNFYPIRIEQHEFTPIQIQNEVFNMKSR